MMKNRETAESVVSTRLHAPVYLKLLNSKWLNLTI